MLTLKGHSFEKNQIILMQLGAFHLMIVILLMPFVLSFHNLFSGFMCPPQSFMQWLHIFCTGCGIYVSTSGRDVQIDKKSGFLQ